MTKKEAIAAIRRTLLTIPEKKFTFKNGTNMPCWLYEELTPTSILSIRVRNNCVLLTSTDEVRKCVEEEKFSEFDIDEIKKLLEILCSQLRGR